MSRLVELYDPNPYEKFALRLSRSREANERAYLSAWAASDECNRLMKEVHFTWAATKSSFLDGSPWPHFAGRTPAENTDELLQQAVAEDQHCDSQASIVVSFADDVLQAFGRGVLGHAIGYRPFGKEFNGGVRLTQMLRATTANARHVSEWADIPFPYPTPDEASADDKWRGALKNIDILKRAFGVGENGPIRDVSSWRALVQMDGLYGTHPADFGRVENVIVQAARHIATSGTQGALSILDAELQRRQL